MSELRPYEREYDDDIRQDSEEDIRRSDRFDNNEVSVKTSLISFIIVIVVMFTIFFLNAFNVIPWWATLASSLLVVIVLLILRAKARE